MSINRTTFVNFFICIQCYVCLCGAQLVTFDVSNRKFDGVTFTGEKNVVFKCCVGNRKIDIIKIEHPLGNSSVKSSQESDCLELTINEVDISDGGEYRCIVNYTCMDGGHGSEVLTEYLNVRADNDVPQCVRNGTHGEEYGPGDYLLLSCYCRVSHECQWVSTVESHRNATTLVAHNRSGNSGIRELQVLVHYTKNTDNGTRYDCLYVDNGNVERCSVGPQNVSSERDVVVSNTPMQSEESYICQDVKESPASTESTGAVEIVTTMRTTIDEPSQDIYKFVAIAGGGILLILVTLIIILILIFCRRRSGAKNNKVNDTRGQKNYAYTADDNDSHTYYNQDADIVPTASSAYPQKDPNIESSPATTVPVTNDDTRDTDSHDYDDPAPTRGVSSEFEEVDMPNDDYAEIRDSTTSRRGTSRGLRGVGMASGYSDGFDNFLRAGREGGNDGEDEVSALYDAIDKTKEKSVTSNATEDFSGLYAEVNKQRNRSSAL